MPHIGNDIVDLDLPDNLEKIRDRRFLDRVFSDSERNFIEQHQDHGNDVLWALWAAKESAYKALSKGMPDIPSTPRRYRVVFSVLAPDGTDSSDGQVQKTGPNKDSIWTGNVKTPAGNVFCQALLTPDYVHCLAVTGGFLQEKRMISQVLKWNEQQDPSVTLRRAVIQRIADTALLNSSAIEIKRHSTPKGLGPPCVFVHNQPSTIDISLSHDGRYGAFALWRN